MPNVSPRRRLFGGLVGTFVEWYDFLIYGLSAPVLAAHFFPDTNPTAALLGTFGIYAVAFLVRPLGGVFFGYLGDRGGRIKTLALTVLLMGAATMLTGLLPTYETIGIWAAVLLLICRLGQGFSAGGETSGGLSYIVESAPDNRRARWISYCVAASFLPVVVASLLIVGLRLGLGHDAYTSWGWRIPFLVGGILALVGLWLRRRLDDPDEYVEAVSGVPVTNPIRSAARQGLSSIVRVILLVAVQAVGAYMLLSFMYSYLITSGDLSETSALLTNALSITVMAALVPVFGSLADRIGRKPLMMSGALWLLAGAWPALHLASSGSVAGAITGQLVLAVGVALFASGGFVTMLELFSTSIRFTGHAIGYNIGYAVFGGTTPLVAVALVDSSGSDLAPAFYLMVIAAIGLLAVTWTPETRTLRLRDAGATGNAAADDHTPVRSV